MYTHQNEKEKEKGKGKEKEKEKEEEKGRRIGRRFNEEILDGMLGVFGELGSSLSLQVGGKGEGKEKGKIILPPHSFSLFHSQILFPSLFHLFLQYSLPCRIYVNNSPKISQNLTFNPPSNMNPPPLPPPSPPPNPTSPSSPPTPSSFLLLVLPLPLLPFFPPFFPLLKLLLLSWLFPL